MAVATYTRHVLYTGPQIAMLRMISQRRLPQLCDRNGWRAIDNLHAKGAVLQHGEAIELTERGKHALSLGTQRVVRYERKSEVKNMDEDVLAETSFDEALALDIEDLCGQDMHLGGLDESMFEDLKHDCLDYYKDWKAMPEVQAVQAWGELVYAKVTQRQAESIVKAAEKELAK